MTHSSYHIVVYKAVQRSLGKSPAKSFVQELNLLNKCHKCNTEELIIPERKEKIRFTHAIVPNKWANSQNLETELILLTIIFHLLIE